MTLERVSHGRLFDQLRDVATAVQFSAVRAVGEAVDAGTEAARGTTLFHDQSGALRRSIVGRKNGDSGFIRAGSARVGYARNVEDGTPAHPIVARNAQTLRFVQNGRVVFRRAVFHPGTAPRPFMYEARRVAEKVFAYGLELHVGEAIKKYSR